MSSAGFLREHIALTDAETVLFVGYDKPDVRYVYPVGYQRMRAENKKTLSGRGLG
ncbi:hypothetical protein SDC9_86821 [bioreactor metagenome]|uniref:Uncharacterized protein n=1 Tax=bioreactor metagenome TaxID=1076179 RepID=A0A644ZJZ8_9ZZZZ